jgi:hypothetical protein
MDREYVSANQAAFDRLQAMVGRLTDDDLQRELDNGWTVSVALVHLAFFDRRAARLVERWQRDGYGPSPYDADAINDAMLPAWQLIPPRDAANEAFAAANEADAAVAGLSEDLLEQVRRHGGIKPNRAEHRENHLAEMEALFL